MRALIWEGVVDMMLKPHAPIQTPDGKPDPLNMIRPLVGYGPESMWVAYNRFYPPDLAHYEARNASPDRSHNETFDTLVRGGIIQFAAQLFLYVSIFFYSLRWLGLIRGHRRRNLFIAALIAGGALGVIAPLIFDGSLRLAGIGLPAGLILGMIVYVTADLLLSGRSEINAPAVGSVAQTSGRRQLLILALFAAIVAHFVEVHFGIAIASTLTLFWVLAGTLVAVGMGWIEDEDQVKVEAKASSASPRPSAQPAGGKLNRPLPRQASRNPARRRTPMTHGRHRELRPQGALRPPSRHASLAPCCNFCLTP